MALHARISIMALALIMESQIFEARIILKMSVKIRKLAFTLP